MFKVALAVIASMAAAGVAAQGMYRWVDKDGRVHYGDKPPTEAAKQVETRKVTPNVVETSTAGYESQAAAKKFPVALYTHPDCKEPCNDARALLSKRGVPFSEIVVSDEKQRAELIRLAGAAEVPVMTVGKEVQKGYEAGLYSAALDRAGYPKTAAPARSSTSSATTPANAPQAAKAAVEEKAAPKGKYLP
jgi:glutaredoxin